MKSITLLSKYLFVYWENYFGFKYLLLIGRGLYEFTWILTARSSKSVVCIEINYLGMFKLGFLLLEDYEVYQVEIKGIDIFESAPSGTNYNNGSRMFKRNFMRLRIKIKRTKSLGQNECSRWNKIQVFGLYMRSIKKIIELLKLRRMWLAIMCSA